MNDDVTHVAFQFRLGEVSFATVHRRLLVRNEDPFAVPSEDSCIESLQIPASADGILLRSTTIKTKLRRLSFDTKRLTYVPRQYERYYVDLSTTYDEYLDSFSRKSRSNLRRKLRKFERRTDGNLRVATYKSEKELEEFYVHARSISEKTYQERLLDAGLPVDAGFRVQMLKEARNGNVRAYLLFMRERAVAYLYSPIRNGVVQYAFLGYLPDHADLSPGTVLLWLVMEELFSEAKHRLFDFTEGGDSSKHSQKRLFSTGSVRCADVYSMRLTPLNLATVVAQTATEWLAETIGRTLAKIGIKRRIKMIIRRWA